MRRGGYSLLEMSVVTGVTAFLAAGLWWAVPRRAAEEPAALSGLWALHDELLHARSLRAGLDEVPWEARAATLWLVDREARLAHVAMGPEGLLLRRFDPLKPGEWETRCLVPGARAVLFDRRLATGAVRFHLFTDHGSILGSVRPLDPGASP